MLIHLRLTTPPDLSDQLVELLRGDDRVTNLVRIPGACVEPAGDLITVDVAREAADDVLSAVLATGLGKRGGIALVPWASTPFDAAIAAEQAAEGDPDDAVIWDVVLERSRTAARSTISFHVFLVLAVLLAAVALVTDSSVLVVGAMVVGPEFATVAAIDCGIAFRDVGLILRGLRLLVISFTASILIVALLALIARPAGLVTAEMITRPRPQTGFVWHPDTWSFIVALIAGAAGVLALTLDKAQAMVGVFISVTTVPAAGNLALGLALWVPDQIIPSLTQLGVNLLGMILAGAVVILLQRWAWARFARYGKHLPMPRADGRLPRP